MMSSPTARQGSYDIIPNSPKHQEQYDRNRRDWKLLKNGNDVNVSCAFFSIVDFFIPLEYLNQLSLHKTRSLYNNLKQIQQSIYIKANSNKKQPTPLKPTNFTYEITMSDNNTSTLKSYIDSAAGAAQNLVGNILGTTGDQVRESDPLVDQCGL